MFRSKYWNGTDIKKNNIVGDKIYLKRVDGVI
jgi:hypothetical protein